MANPPEEPQQSPVDKLESLEMPDTETNVGDARLGNWPDIESPSAPMPVPGGLKARLRKINPYALLFSLLMVIGLTIVLAAYWSDKKGSTAPNIASQTLSQKTFEELANSDATLGDPSKVLSVQSNAVFTGKVLVRQGLEVAGNLQVGGTLGLNSLAVAGTAQFGQAQVNKDLSVAGNTGLQGAVNIAKSLQVSGNGSFGGNLTAAQVTASSLQLNGDLTLTHHLVIGGSTPGRSNGGALGSGGTVSLSGSDSGGTITINTGSSPAAGCFIAVNFVNRFAATPRVLLTPVGSAAGSLDFYVNRSSTSFSVCDATPPPAGSSFGFDYFVFD
jgi:cytoskeletal protein CcmA (bactofilin family)